MEQERRNHLRESILHKELEEALKVKVVETLEVDSAAEELVKEDNKDDFVLEGEEIDGHPDGNRKTFTWGDKTIRIISYYYWCKSRYCYGGEFVVDIEFNSRDTLIATIKDSTIIRVWITGQYNGSHTYTKTIIYQDHVKLNSDMIVKVKSVIAEVQSKFNYMTSYRKAWLAK
ncbi:hypothetical protein Ahy_A03g014658 [Arachis hypogaea]|uniref:Uncharacterized protein n=1 Tax=Arachis hypogaea TaxID=3818 RepID=A0A445DYG7_ARAHY|nr:hypothetical protein Ahy_A03g014658 [Arachis hypogaea]